MNKGQFLSQLEKNLSDLSKSEREQHKNYYEELIEDYVENGCSEKQAVKKLGSASEIAVKIISEQTPRNLERKRIKPFTIAMLTLGFPLWGSLVFALILVILSGYVVIWCLPFITGFLAITGLTVTIISVPASIFAIQDGLFIAVTQFGTTIFLFGLSILSGIATVKISKLFLTISKNFTLKIYKIAKEGITL